MKEEPEILQIRKLLKAKVIGNVHENPDLLESEER